MRIIINDKTNGVIDVQTVMNLVSRVIDEGEISNGRFGKQYCFLTTFSVKVFANGASTTKVVSVAVERLKSGTQTFTLTAR